MEKIGCPLIIMFDDLFYCMGLFECLCYIIRLVTRFQTLYERVHSRMADRESQSPIENPFSARGAIQQTKEILSNTNKATRKVRTTNQGDFLKHQQGYS